MRVSDSIRSKGAREQKAQAQAMAMAMAIAMAVALAVALAVRTLHEVSLRGLDVPKVPT